MQRNTECNEQDTLIFEFFFRELPVAVRQYRTYVHIPCEQSAEHDDSLVSATGILPLSRSTLNDVTKGLRFE